MAEPRDYRQADLFRPALEAIIDMRHPLVRLAGKIDWGFLDRRFGEVYAAGGGQPPLPVRLIAGLFILKHMHSLSDEAVCARWVENPYFQYFCGERVFRHALAFDRSSLTRWRRRLGEERLSALLQESLRDKRDKRDTCIIPDNRQPAIAVDDVDNGDMCIIPGREKRGFSLLAKVWGLQQYCQVLEATLRAYMYRTESRVAFIREDFPVIDNVNWVKMIVIQLQNRQLKLWDEPLPESYHLVPVRPTQHLHLAFRKTEGAHASS